MANDNQSNKQQKKKKKKSYFLTCNGIAALVPSHCFPSPLNFHNKILKGEKLKRKGVNLELNTNNAICHDSIFKQKSWPALIAI